MQRTLWAFLISMMALQPAIAAPQADYTGKTILDGAYTDEQAKRGYDAYTANCARCHGANLLGNNSPLKDERFVERWREDKLDLVYGVIKSTMPRGRAGSLSEAMYTDIVSYLLQENGYPAGSAELTPADLSKTQFVGFDGPAAVPNLVLVKTVGCLASAPREVWNLTTGSEPIRTRKAEEVSADEIKSGETTSLGSHTFRLNLDNLLTPFDPAPHVGHKMYIKGVINRQGGERINVTSMGMVAEACMP